jgi:hypothetical protein
MTAVSMPGHYESEEKAEAREHRQRICQALRVSRRVGLLSIEEQKAIHAARAGFDWLAFRAFMLQRSGRLQVRTVAGRPYLVVRR